MQRRPIRLLIIGLALAACTSTFALAQMATQPYGPIPPPRHEVVPPPPGTRYIWQPGHWYWNGRAYVWVGGRYVVRQPRWTGYVPGRWARSGPNWVWIPAHWR